MTIIFAAGLASVGFAAESYVGAAGQLILPQGGGRLDLAGGAVVRAGTYLAEPFALEFEAGQTEKYTTLTVDGIFHLSGIYYYDYLFGFSRFDPFFSVGARGWFDGDGRGEVGPKSGLGAFYHLSDHWSLRFDVDATLGLNGREEVDYTFSAGLQYFF